MTRSRQKKRPAARSRSPTLAKPLKQDIEMPVNTSMDLSSSTGAKIGGAAVLAISALLYFIFSGLWF